MSVFVFNNYFSGNWKKDSMLHVKLERMVCL